MLVILLLFVGFEIGRQRELALAPKPTADSLATLADSARALAAPGTAADAGDTAASLAAPPVATIATPAVPEREIVVETPLYRATFSNRGARLVRYELKRYAAAHGVSSYGDHPARRPRRGAEVPEGDRVQLSGDPTFALELGSASTRRPLDQLVYAVEESTDAFGAIRALRFSARDTSGLAVEQVWRVTEQDHLLSLSVRMPSVPQAWRLTDYSLITRSWPLLNEADPEVDKRSLRAIGLVGKNMHRDHAPGLVGKPEKAHDGVARWAGVQSHYFLNLVASVGREARSATSAGARRTLTPEQLERLPAGTPSTQDLAIGALVMPLPDGSETHHFAVYLGPADYFALTRLSAAIDPELHLERAVDMGWQWIVPVSNLLLRLLLWLDGLVRNFGVAILALATVVRLVLHPLNMASMKSMRGLQKVQPEVERIRDKYKNDPQAMNTAIMALYRDHKVNPAGGCVPMLAQMPLFFALYAVLFNAIALRQAPFAGWIHDLSAPDLLFQIGPAPIRLLPILMAGSGLLSQWLTPTDPKQAPTMYLMNVVMLVFFYNLPSGLVFYWTVMNLFTALQQWMVMRGDDGVVVVTPGSPVPATAGGKRKRR